MTGRPRPGRWRRRLRRTGIVLAVALAALLGWHGWLLVNPTLAQDRCTFGSVTNDAYRALLADARSLANANHPEMRRLVGAYDEAGIAALLRLEFEELSAGIDATAGRIAAVHAIMRANGAEYRRPYPDTTGVFADLGLPPAFGSVQFWYRFNINGFGAIEPLRPFSIFRADYMLRDSSPQYPGDEARPRDDFDFVAILMSFQDVGLVPERSAVDADCPPVPSPEWEEAFRASPAPAAGLSTAETRIFFEDRTAVPLLGGHAYLVRRDIIRDASGAILAEYNPTDRADGRRADQIIRANSSDATGGLKIFMGRLADSLEHMGTTSITSRRSTDITDMIMASGRFATPDEAWAAMSAFAVAASGIYEYETAGLRTSANSNSVVQSALNAAGIDARSIANVSDPRYLLGFPGIESLITTGDWAAGVPAYHPAGDGFYVAGIQFRGRDAFDDVLFGTPFADGFYGEQNAGDLATRDTVSYANSNAGVRVDIALSRTLFGSLVLRGEGHGGHAEGDRFTGVENIVGSPFDDVLTTTGDLANELDGGAGNDTLTGGAGDDTYRFGPVWGADRIEETTDPSGPDGDRVVFTSDIRREDVTFARPSGTDDLLVTGRDGSAVIVAGHFAGKAVEWFVFTTPSGETRLSADDVANLIAARTG